MPSYPLKALVLRKTKLGETDIILTLLAQDGSQVRAVAKGLRKPSSRFGGRLEPFSVVDLLMHTGKSLELITEARTVTAHAGLREDLDRSASAAVVADLLDKISVQGQVEPRLFDLSVTSLSVFETAPSESLPALVIAFLLKAMAMHGYRPELENCAACACDAAGSSDFSLSHGGVVCAECGALDPGTLRFPVQARAWLTRLLGSTMAEVAACEMPAAAVADCFALVRSFVGYHLPARLKALDYYAGMAP
ncbi:MAG: DNA repair protein RecO [Actinobacteria bacterium HGW-Actinobacteria-7]|nr:MAG: DNA repair protein RecO [Actinobacteria bacterium HGW-Actinobacteria-7]